MKLFIWEGRGISAGYHDDGTLVVLAETVQEARKVARASMPRELTYGDDDYDEINAANEDPQVWNDRFRGYYRPEGIGDKAISRQPDRIVDLEEPCVVVFNGGGYD